MRVEALPAEPRPWKQGLAWLAVLGPFFFLTYGFGNSIAARRDDVPSVVFAWEHAIPFLPWTIVPYWAIDLLYGVALVACATRAQLHTHVRRLLAAQCIAVACFIAFPLRFSFERPPVEGLFGAMFAALESFDQPFNQAPSLHVALLVILWPVFWRALAPAWHGVLHVGMILIGISVLTTWQHHFIDLPTGAWLGFFCIWLFAERDQGARWQLARSRDPVRRKIAACYAVSGCALAWLALEAGGVLLWLLWPAASLLLVASVYLWGDARIFLKDRNGQLSIAARALLAPYFAGAWINARLWTRSVATADEVYPGVHLGSIVRCGQRLGASATLAIVDVCAELAYTARAPSYQTVPMLDLVAPTIDDLERAAHAIEIARAEGPVLVGCALGFSRSAAAIVAWLLRAGIATTLEEAVDRVRRARPAVVLAPHYIDALRAWQHAHSNAGGATEVGRSVAAAVT